jgi:hypothetical protein
MRHVIDPPLGERERDDSKRDVFAIVVPHLNCGQVA